MATGEKYTVGGADVYPKIAALSVLVLAILKNSPSGQRAQLRSSLRALTANDTQGILPTSVRFEDALNEAEKFFDALR